MPEIISQGIRDAVHGIMSDYEKGRSIDKLDVFRQPDRQVVTELTKKMFRIVFPGFFRDKSYRVYQMQSSLSLAVEDIAYLLNKQVQIALRYSRREEEDEHIIEELSERITLEFLKAIPEVRDYIETDVQATMDGDPAAYSEDEVISSYPGIYAITVHRLAHVLYRLGVPVLPRIMSEYAHSRTGIDIHPGATIGKSFFIDHGTGIVIGETTTIGNHVKIYQGVTLGALSTKGGRRLKSLKRHPTIEDHVTIYSGASILGGNTIIGEGAVIGGNAFVTKSVAPFTKISVKNQELHYDKKKHVVNKTDFEEDEAWFYVI
ncbi:MAG: serine acetyltransferase [Selenomonadaceae bacterium]|nr:serine acetyltransferase [Selenomonadaceae bacterium]